MGRASTRSTRSSRAPPGQSSSRGLVEVHGPARSTGRRRRNAASSTRRWRRSSSSRAWCCC
eukprot:49002-Lingulodinium_polyedra.AAC.1